MQHPISLYELNNLVRQTLTRAWPDEYWVQAELSDVRVNPAGHCYVEFVQKDARSHALIAKARGTVWSNVFRLLRPYFERETGQTFAAGIKVLVLVRVEFHELYGYSLTVVDIDPSYTMGDMVRRRREILRMLEEEGVLTLNRELSLSPVPQRIAVISSETAAGYGDFCNQLATNPYGLQFFPTLFPAIMQGDKVEASVLDALSSIQDASQEWDAVVIIRGGGAVSDLSGFDTYLLAAACAQFPVPIITGIGHERDDTVLDLVAHTRVKTPTAAAEFLINRVHEAALKLEDKAGFIEEYVRRRMQEETHRLDEMARRIPAALALRRLREEHRVEQMQQRSQAVVGKLLQQSVHRLQLLEQRSEVAAVALVQNARHHLQLMEQRVAGCDYQRLLARGFSLTLKDGRAMTDASILKPGDTLVTRLGKGEVYSQVINVKSDKTKKRRYGKKENDL